MIDPAQKEWEAGVEGEESVDTVGALEYRPAAVSPQRAKRRLILFQALLALILGCVFAFVGEASYGDWIVFLIGITISLLWVAWFRHDRRQHGRPVNLSVSQMLSISNLIQVPFYFFVTRGFARGL